MAGGNRLHGVFITGTDTGVGKTRFTAAMAVLLREAGLKVGLMKPIATGAEATADGLVSLDTRRLREALPADTDISLHEITPMAFEPPVAPSVAARASGRFTDVQAIQRVYERLRDRFDVILVEGIGGAMVPLGVQPSLHGDLSERRWGDVLASDLCARLDLPAVVVAPDALGAISQTLLTLSHLETQRVPVLGVMLNQRDANADSHRRIGPSIGVPNGCENLEEITRVGRVPAWGPLPYVTDQAEFPCPEGWRMPLEPLVAMIQEGVASGIEATACDGA